MQQSSSPFPPKLSALFDRIDAIPRPLSVAGAIVLLGLSAAVDWLLVDKGVAFPVYYLVPVIGLALIAGWRPALVATVFCAAVGLLIEPVFGQPPAETLGYYLGRIATFAGALILARGLSIVRMMIYYYSLGDYLRSRIVPIRIGPRLVSIPTSESDIQTRDFELKPGDIPLLIRPGIAFGSGSHPTTQMCLMLLETYLEPGQVVFDFGCGSGILSIAAAKLGARAVLAVDNAAEAEETIRKNVDLNRVGEIVHFRRGSWPIFTDPPRSASAREDRRPGPHEKLDPSLTTGQADLLLANILTSIIVEALEEGLLRCVMPGGKLILSGIRTDQWDEIHTALEKAELTMIDQRKMGEWLALVVSSRA
jgi:ribosomal protein L11 methylase PrmA